MRIESRTGGAPAESRQRFSGRRTLAFGAASARSSTRPFPTSGPADCGQVALLTDPTVASSRVGDRHSIPDSLCQHAMTHHVTRGGGVASSFEAVVDPFCDIWQSDSPVGRAAGAIAPGVRVAGAMGWGALRPDGACPGVVSCSRAAAGSASPTPRREVPPSLRQDACGESRGGSRTHRRSRRKRRWER